MLSTSTLPFYKGSEEAAIPYIFICDVVLDHLTSQKDGEVLGAIFFSRLSSGEEVGDRHTIH